MTQYQIVYEIKPEVIVVYEYDEGAEEWEDILTQFDVVLTGDLGEFTTTLLEFLPPGNYTVNDAIYNRWGNSLILDLSTNV